MLGTSPGSKVRCNWITPVQQLEMDSNGSVPTLLSAVMVRARHPEQWPVSVYVALGAMIIYAVASSVSRPPFPKLAPKLVDESWPIIGSWAFWTERTNFWRRHLSKTSIGHFSFYFGPHQLVCLSGTEGRKFFFESKHLSMTEGYVTVLGVALIPIMSCPAVLIVDVGGTASLDPALVGLCGRNG